jgi:hypothetical protein
MRRKKDTAPALPTRPVRILFVFAWLVVGGEETGVTLLARHLDPRRYRIDVTACFHRDGMPDQTHAALRALGVTVDTTPYTLSFDDTVRYIERKVVGYDIIVSCQNVANIYPALERLGQSLSRHVARTYAVDAVIPWWEALFSDVLAEVMPAPPQSLFRSFRLGGFEGSTHRLASGKRLDLTQSTGHADNAPNNYRQLRDHGVTAVRDSLRWHLAEPPGQPRDLSHFRDMLSAATAAGTQVIWDLMHDGWPDDIDIRSPAFVTRFADFARAAASLHRDMTDAVPFWCKVNEISFFAWASGAAIAAMHALRDTDPRARFVHSEPMIAIHHDPTTSKPLWEAEGHHQSQFQALELLMGRMWPQIGGHLDYLDIIGVNYYWNNQWVHGGPTIDIGHPLHRPLSDL